MLIASSLAWLPLLIAVACPLVTILMMRGMRGGHEQGDAKPREQMSLEELKQARDQLNEEIAERASGDGIRYPIGV